MTVYCRSRNVCHASAHAYSRPGSRQHGILPAIAASGRGLRKTDAYRAAATQIEQQWECR